MTLRALSVVLAALALCACGQKQEATSDPVTAPEPAPSPAPAPPATPAAAPAPAAALAAHEQHTAAAAAAATVDLPTVPAGAKVFFVAPADGSRIEGALVEGRIALPVKMGAKGIAIKPAGPVEAGSGHHHVLIDSAPIAAGAIVPKDEQHLHFGQGQTEATLQLTPGEHTLTMQLADGIHRSYGEPLAATIKVTVVPAAPPADATKKN